MPEPTLGVLGGSGLYDLPRGQRRLLQRAEGIVEVLVNGTPVVADGAPTDRRPGRVLRGGA